VNHAVELAEFVKRKIEETTHLLFARNIGPNGPNRLRAIAAELLGRSREIRVGPTADRNVGAVAD
jgi:hypothetical protein